MTTFKTANFDAKTIARTLIGGMPISQFNCQVREKQTVRFAAALQAKQINQLCDLSNLEGLLDLGAIDIACIDVFDHSHLIRLADIHRKSGKSVVTVIADSILRGSTIRIRDINKFDERLNRFALEVQRCFVAESQINVYLTPPERVGFPPHFDITDVFVLQCSGKKAWKIFHDYSHRVELPLMETAWNPDRFKPSGKIEDITLEPGDVLYMPRGVMHQASCEECESLHLTISIVPLTFADLIAKMLRAVAEGDLDFRRRVPWSTEVGGGEQAEVLRQTKDLISRLAERSDIDRLLDKERGAYLVSPETTSFGQLEAAVTRLRQKAGRETKG
jgi:hypothetical protein